MLQVTNAGSLPVGQSAGLPVGEKYKIQLVFSRWYLVFTEEKIKYKEGYEMQKTIYRRHKYLNK